jgi:gamma-glutamylputrescine oxidase
MDDKHPLPWFEVGSGAVEITHQREMADGSEERIQPNVGLLPLVHRTDIEWIINIFKLKNPSSYWQETTKQTTTNAPILSGDLPASVDVAIIGGGILGASIGYSLTRTGIKAAILERTALAYGATGRNGGFVSVGTAESYASAILRLGHKTARAVLNITRENQVILRRILADEEIACEYAEPGRLSLALSEDQLRSLKQDVAAFQDEGIDAKILGLEEVQGLIRTPLSEEIVGGKFVPEQGVVHPLRLVQDLVEAAQRRGMRAYLASVLQLLLDGASVLIRTTQGNLHARTVIVTTNAWTSEILPQLSTLITPVRGQVLAYAPTSLVFPIPISASITPTGEYWQQRSDGTIILGGCRAAAPNHDTGILLNQPTPEVQSALEQIFPRLFPQLRKLQVRQRWAGPMAFTRDYIPIIDHLPNLPHIWVVAGFSGHGMPFGLRLGELLAEALTNGTWPGELEAFKMDRLSSKE